jgi:hypothetical protein
MSADNWTICPQCHKKWREPESHYGKVSEEEYLASISKPKPLEPETLREDWSIGMDQLGVLDIIYKCSCTDCGFHHEFKAHDQADIAPKGKRLSQKKGTKR